MLDEEQVEILISKIKTDDQEAKTKLVKNYRNYIYSVANNHSRGKSHLTPDLVSAGFYGLCKAINNINNFSEGNFLAFISPYIKGAIIDELAVSRHHVAPSTNRSRKHRNQEPIIFKQVPMGNDGELLGEIHEDRVLRQGWSKCKQYQQPSTLREDIYEILISEQERQVVNYRIMGFTLRETASKIDCSLVKVVRILNKIQERFENKYGNL